MSSINNALLASGALKAQPHAVLVASVADGADEIERLRSALLTIISIYENQQMSTAAVAREMFYAALEATK